MFEGDSMRYPHVAGSFYSGDANRLRKEINGFLKQAVVKVEGEIVAGVVPHAGYLYSGQIAGYTFNAIAQAFPKPPVFVLVGPNHTGHSTSVSVSKKNWVTPLGVVKNDVELGAEIVKQSRVIAFDDLAHEFEHSLEVQLPFLQTIYSSGFQFVPIAVMLQDYAHALAIAKAVFEAEKKLKRQVFLLASSDFTHYEPEASAKRKDALALKEAESLNAKKFVETIESNKISVCGFAPIAAAIEYAKLKRASRAQVLKYGDSGDITGDRSSVVAYCSIAFVK
ncbi:MEMO1 family protein [Candidatus Micrarchaeota archaeon]|nr:MEMO1 family protein [Candidatus Micrarchaeota archaeon]